MDLDTSWIDEFNQEEKKYHEFYKQEINGIRIVLFFINEHNELIATRVPPGDRWKLVSDPKKQVHPTLTEVLEAYLHSILLGD